MSREWVENGEREGMIVNGIFLKSNNINKIKESYGDA
jgi:hypothetical protein